MCEACGSSSNGLPLLSVQPMPRTITSFRIPVFPSAGHTQGHPFPSGNREPSGSHRNQKKRLYQGPNARDVKVRALSFQQVPGLSENTCNTYALGKELSFGSLKLSKTCIYIPSSQENIFTRKKKKQKGLVMAYQVPLNQGLSLPNCERPEPAFSSFQPTVETTPTLASRHLRKYKLLFQSRVEGGMQTFCRSRSRPLWRSSGRTAPNKLSTL